MPTGNDSEFWKRKLAAYLHDPPSKCLNIATHGKRSDAAFRQAGFAENEVGIYPTQADYTAAAADRLPFPRSQAASLYCTFDGIRNTFRHPLNGTPLPFHKKFNSVGVAFEGENSIQPQLTAHSLPATPNDAAIWRARFFAHWRLWPRRAVQLDYRLALLPADTRIPDHSIWNHMQVVSALAGCIPALTNNKLVLDPAFLKFQLGPVQEFIAAARSIRDLWSGSYLLSWLMAAGLKKLSEIVGPDTVIFPNLREQPLLDLHWRNDLWSEVSISGQGSVWDSLGWSNRHLLTPNLPNVFLAVVPATRATELAETVGKAIEDEWKRIAEAVWKACEQAGLTADEGGCTADRRKSRFDAQVERFLSLSWQVTPWPKSLEDALKLADGFAEGMPIQQARARVQAVVHMAENQMPPGHRDRRFYTDDKKTTLNNLGLGWSVILAFNSWQLDAVRQTRAFPATNTGGWQVGTFSNKDALTGREEAVAGGRTWAERAKKAGAPWATLFKHDDWLGAATLIKRTWHRAYLAAKPWNLKTDASGFPMPNTRGVAAHEPESDCGNDETADDAPPSEKYFAVLALDGDEIGKWISGEKTPKFATQLADYRDSYGVQRQGSKPYFEQEGFMGFLDQQRPLSPSYHLQFSEALSNFALLCARPIVEAFHGRLIYAGGDNVVALLPADTALACAQALRMAFQGCHVSLPGGETLFTSPARGFLHSEKFKDQQRKPIPILVPGPAADCSVGIAIAHFKAPLQDVVRAAWDAEDRAKKKLGRSAVAVTLCKRSGETIEWGTKWDGGGLKLYRAIADALKADQLSAKFPHRFTELLEAYVTDSTPLIADNKTVQPLPNFPVKDIIRREFEHCLDRQRGTRFPREKEAAKLLKKLHCVLKSYLASLCKQDPSDPSHPSDLSDATERALRSLIGLCQTVAFAHHTAAETINAEPKGT